MLDILAITGPIYLCIAMGYLGTRMGVFSKPDLRVLGKFVLNLALPALLFNAIAQRPLADVMHMDYLLAYGLALVLVFIGGKMLLIDFVKIPIGYALLVTATLIAGSIFLSLRNSGEAAKGAPPALPPKA